MEEPANNTVPATQRQQHADQAPGVPSTCTQPIPAVYEQEDDELKDTQVDDDPDDEVNTEDDAQTTHYEEQHRSKGVIVQCGWAIHGMFCDCLEEIVEPPMPATASKKKVTYVVPIKEMKSVGITQEEDNKFYESTVNTDSHHKISKELLTQNLLKIINLKKRVRITDGHPFIRMMLWRMEDNPTAKSELDMVVVMIETNTQKTIHPLNNPINVQHQIKAMRGQTPEPDADEMIEEEEEDPDEEPPGDHRTKKEEEKAQLDVIYQTRLFSDEEKQKITTRLSTIYEDTHNEDVVTLAFKRYMVIGYYEKQTYNEEVLPKNFKKSGLIKSYMKYMMSAINETNYQENVNAKTHVEDMMDKTFLEYMLTNVHENTYKEDVMPVTFEGNVMIENTYQEDALPVTFEENVMSKNCKNYLMSAIHETNYKEDALTETFIENMLTAMYESTYQEDVDDKAYMKNVVVPGAATNKDGQDDPQHNCMMGKTGPQGDTKRLAMTDITSRGEAGGHN